MIFWVLARHTGRAPCPPRSPVALAPMSPWSGGIAPAPLRSMQERACWCVTPGTRRLHTRQCIALFICRQSEDLRCQVKNGTCHRIEWSLNVLQSLEGLLPLPQCQNGACPFLGEVQTEVEQGMLMITDVAHEDAHLAVVDLA